MIRDTGFDPSIRVVAYDPTWPLAFEREAAALRQVLGALVVRVDHVGSTSVPGLAAKPIVDIQVSVPAIAPLEPYQRPLEARGYLFVPDPEFPDYPFFGMPAAPPRTHHVHVCAVGSAHERRHLALRDYLRAHPAEAEAYAAEKRAVAARYAGNALAYVTAKGPYVQALERRALAWARGEASV